MIQRKWNEGKSICVGLDSDPDKIPAIIRSGQDYGVGLFNFAIIDATYDLVCAYKPNLAFYESLGEFGPIALKATINRIRFMDPELPVIGDMKAGDIGNTNWKYVRKAFEYFGFDAITINPYPGREALQPFLDQKNKGIFVLCRTSNEGSDEFQGRNVIVLDRHVPLYRYVAHRVANFWNQNGNCGLVVGATCPEELSEVRMIAGDNMPILIPGIGEQGGDLKAVLKAGRNSDGQGMIINSSRKIIFASSGPDFAEAARKEVIKLLKAVNQCF
ncbi:MAG: orotidine-5'-phosphate decarboxylase [Candidatus Nealsonbacteria bacterium]|nr:orotidine-5'-phosphate decarboxylase [Candidatus Nealsonbacteria bacterium]